MSGQTLAVLGLSRSGMASVAALVAAGARVYAHDDRNSPDLPQGVKRAAPAEWPWDELTAMVISPGIPHLHPAPHVAAAMAAEHHVPVISDIDLLMQAKPQARVIGITGTNGKSTVVTLIKHILDSQGMATALGGNIGTPVLALDDPGKDGVIILELSSYQLETCPNLSLDAGAVINITPDHLDRHGGWDGYVAAKANLARAVKPGGMLVLGDDPAASSLAKSSLAASSLAQAVIARHDNALDRTDCPDLTGPHNAANTEIATLIAGHFGITREDVAHGLPRFKGLAHRMETIATSGAIRFVNDSKATNGDAAAEALKSFDAIYWIAGGTSKDGGLGPAINQLDAVKCAYLIGDSAENFATELTGKCRHQLCGTLSQAAAAAYHDAQRTSPDGATILLSPAAASFDQFTSFEHRGDTFRAIVQDLLTPTSQEARHV
ncbi:MAG: UDP-N-acetylmuramoyl-L-alanine--D-glutamate ligase [Alphaproteobacteria bacterium]|nr:UDP-N-acetylmuramoyl-L-alanine--D-glutamate ligase [Alphaproteobacteria bacterium]